MNKIYGTILLILIASAFCFSQVKSFEDAQNEITNFNDFNAFALFYDETTYLTKAEISIEILDKKDNLKKQFTKFEWQLTAFFAIRGIDRKPVRNVLCVNSQSKSFAFSRENALIILFSDGDVMLGEPNRSSEVRRGKANEKLCWDVDNEIFGDFANSDKIEFQIGTIRGQINADKMQIFKDYAKLLKVEATK